MHLFVDRKHGRNNDQECGCSAAVKMTDQGNDCCHDGHTDHIVTDALHKLVDDYIKHTGICHDSEEQDREHKQGCGRASALKSTFDQVSDLTDGVISTKDKNETKDRWENDECHTWHGLALKKGYNDRNDTDKP